jgi:integrase/recombinase XerD
MSDEDPYNPSAFEEVELPGPVTDYLENYLLGFKPKNTYHNRRSSYRHYQIFCNEHGCNFLDAEVSNIEDFIAHQIRHGYKGSTVENRIYDVSALFKYLSKRSQYPEVNSNPVDTDDIENIKDIRTTKSMSNIRYLKIEEYQKLLDSVEKIRDCVMIMLLWQTGLRAVEAVNIKISDMDRDERSITVNTAKQYEDVERKVWYKRSLETELKKWLDRGGRDSYLRADESPYLLLGKQSRQLNPRRPTEVIRDHAEEVGVQTSLATDRGGAGNTRNKVTAHAFRHSFAVHRIKNGMSIKFLRDLMGHTDIQQTMEYLDVLDEDIREVEERYRP